MRHGGLGKLDRLGHWNAQRQDGARTIGPIAGLSATALRLDEATADRQAKPGSGTAPILGLNAVELVEDAFEVGRRYARPFIDYLDSDDIAVLPGLNFDTAAGRRVLGGVVEQI